MAGGFLHREGLEYEWSISPPGVAAVDAVSAGTAQVVQSAPSQAFNAIARGESDYPLHFAQVNEMDVYEVTGGLPQRYAYQQLCASPPAI